MKDSVIMANKLNPSEAEETIFEVEEVVVEEHNLVVFNDDFNTFEHVIATLKKACKHSQEQAEQCTWLVHYKGKCSVKSGDFVLLKPIKEAICEAGIDARIV